MPDKKYGKPARPFEIWNIGNYETVYWQEKQDEYLAFMFKLYQAQPLDLCVLKKNKRRNKYFSDFY